ncbi:hypothetical protein H9649_04350 [Sporosarcina sp. Sa2YVA2]|uniref:HAD family hydrolase n=1 Tax=Sporosarcina quadrami TaxID=2762234 RepID=A0ABR8U705_9BACL|nr:hypothetical protein [Sporosarcina quadrami]MBD7983802.1 hypothetical protein [Sporosarcina quadrami]
MNWMNELKVIIFDMDGTLYQDDAFLGRYVSHLLDETLFDDELGRVIMEAYDILDGKHAVQLGYFFDKGHHFVYEHEHFSPTDCYSWDGSKSDRVPSDEDSLQFIGDSWGIAHLYAEKYGIEREKRARAFEKVRYEMIEPRYGILRHDPLFESIAALDVERKIFMTNTPGETGPAFVEYLTIGSLFNEYIYDAKKPLGMEAIMKGLMKEGYAPHEILSIGDNPYNDLAPVKRLGGRTCLISQYRHFGVGDWDGTVKTVEELTDFLNHRSTVKL